MKFWRENILWALYLLKNAGLDKWSIEIKQQRLAAWPEEGNLLDMDLDINVTEADENGHEVLAEEQVLAAMLNNTSSVLTNNEGNDAGPAPLQNSEIPEETFEGVLHVHDRSNVNVGQASLAENSVQEAVQHIQQQSDSEVLHGTNIHTTCSQDSTTVTFNQPDVFNYDGGFVDMNKTKYAWARAFPTVFIPNYIQVSENVWEWVILPDITGWIMQQNKEISFVKWCEYMMWRSDGVPVSHSTFALVLSNHKINANYNNKEAMI
jgi:hypothetical protein